MKQSLGSLEWATSCPPPRHNFVTIPRIRSESPAFDLHHPEIAAIELEDNPAAANGGAADAPSMDGRQEVIAERMEGQKRPNTDTDTEDGERR